MSQTHPPGGHGVPSPSAPAPGAPSPVSAIVLLAVAGVALLASAWTVVGLVWAAPVVLAVVSLVKHTTDRGAARRLRRTGWWVAAALATVTVLAAVAVAVALVAIQREAPAGYGTSTVGVDAAAPSWAASRTVVGA